MWFDSGSTWFSVLKSAEYDAGNYPSDMYLEGSDQHRGWFQSSLLLSCILEGKAPYKSVLTHGFTMDERGEKMSKSKGNVILPQEVISTQGSEILRLWVALSDYQNDQKISKNILKQVGEQYKKIRNTLRFLMANVGDLENLCAPNSLSQIDRYILSRAKDVFSQVRANYKEYNFINAMQSLAFFISNELSGIYLDLCKDSLYCDDKNSPIRRAHQSVMLLILSELCLLFAPILTYTINEALGCLPKGILDLLLDKKAILNSKEQAVFGLKNLDLNAYNLALNGVDFSELLSLRVQFNELLDNLKKQKIVKSGLELCINGDFGLFKESAKWFIVSDFKAQKTQELGRLKVGEKEFIVARSAGEKCPRCWRYMGESRGHNDSSDSSHSQCLCARCKDVLSNINSKH